ncbi:MAG: PTS glucose transporter subunit IIA [Clostridium sp.]|uniref:PTS sugar transporter subunit IIA n=1 Tax=uncultured Clostridium sp. TaxID=59620 RepID=UPI00345E04BE|nr:PTS glucose transporter subunit IIA [Clostridium sp.]
MEKKEEIEKPLVERIEIYSPISGTFEKLSNVPDEIFSNNLNLDGAAIIPNDGKVYAPADGKVISIMENNKKIIFKTNTGVELLIHIGLDTSNLNNKYFKAHVTKESEVNLGDLLIEFDIEALKNEGFNLLTPIIIKNIDDYIKAVPMFSEKDEVQILDNILTIV